jgi:hypothetical protein
MHQRSHFPDQDLDPDLRPDPDLDPDPDWVLDKDHPVQVPDQNVRLCISGPPSWTRTRTRTRT